MELIDGEPLNRVIGKLATVDVTEASAARIAEILVGSAHLEQTQTNAGAPCRGIQPAPTSAQAKACGSTTKDTPAEPSSSSMRRGRIYFQHVARWMADVADALDYAHRQGIIHRDIKPSNLILSRDGRLMIADFGLARASEDKSITMTGSLVGTLRYMSPEQAMAKRLRLDHRTDVYSVGVTMYELLTFQPAFHGRDEKEILSQVITLDPTAPRKLNPSVPHDLDTICLKCVEKAPSARFATARDLAADLQRYIDDVPIVAQPPSPLTRSVKFIRRHRTKSVAAAGALLLVLVGLIAINQIQARRAEQVRRLVDTGTRCVTEQRWDDAEAALARVLAIDPRNARAMFLQAWSKLRQSDTTQEPEAKRLLGEADELCRRARDIDPTAHWGLNYHGIILKKLKRYPEAIDAYEKAVELKPEHYPGWVNLATRIFAPPG